MTDLSGLPAELRKVAKNYHIYCCLNCKRQLVESDMGKKCGFCGCWAYEMDCKINVLPADLVEKEMENKDVEIKFWKSSANAFKKAIVKNMKRKKVVDVFI